MKFFTPSTKLQGLAAALLTLDLGSKLEGLDTRKRLSTLGCTMLISLFSYIKVPSLNESSSEKRTEEGGEGQGEGGEK